MAGRVTYLGEFEQVLLLAIVHLKDDAHGSAIRQEIEEKVPPLIADGGFIPLADGRVRADVPFENYVYYRQLLEKITQSI